MKDYTVFELDVDTIDIKSLETMSRGEKTDYLKKLAKDLSDLDDLLAEQEHGLANITSNLSNYELRPSQYQKTKDDIADYRSYYEKSRSIFEENERIRAKLEKKVKEIQSLVEGKKNLDKRRLFRNIRELANEKSIKLGSIERSAGCQAGYMSRLEKLGNITDPTAEFIITAAKELGVTIDFLVNGSVGNVSPAEEYLFKFLCKLRVNTLKGNLIWTRESMKSLTIPNTTESEETTGHPLFAKMGTALLTKIKNYEYKSLFLSEEIVNLVGNCYRCKLNTGGTDLYMMPCEAGTYSEYFGEVFYEFYVVNGKEIHPVICTAQASEMIKDVAGSLYEELEYLTSQMVIDETVQGIIDDYMESN